MTTARQAGPRLLSLLGELRPTFHLPDITSLDRAFLAKHSVSALLWDVDGTLMPHHDRFVAPELEVAFSALRGHVPQAILSNCGDARLLELGAIFGDIPVFKAYATDGRTVMRRLERGQDLWKAGRTHLQRPTGTMVAIRKPSAELVRLVLEEIEVEAERRPLALMVGDQHFTDVAGANLAGIRSVKVRTHAPRSFPLPIRCFHLFERSIYRVLHGRPRR